MYPVLRLAKEMIAHRNAPPIALRAAHVSEHICWPWDIDLWRELNNGRTLTLYDLGRIPMAARAGLLTALKDNRWGLTVAGSTIRYRRRIRMFERFTQKSRVLGWDARFLYVEQSMWKRDGECASHVLIRTAITDANGIVAPARVAAALGLPETSPELPAWVEAWIAADAHRPWPPMQDDLAA